MKAAEWIDRVKAVKHWDSDYRVAKELALSRQAVSDYRKKSSTMDEDTALKVATALGINPAGIIIDQVAERSKSPALRDALSQAARQLCILCKVVFAAGLVAPQP